MILVFNILGFLVGLFIGYIIRMKTAGFTLKEIRKLQKKGLL